MSAEPSAASGDAAAKCQATTKTGKPCPWKAMPGSLYCGHHAKIVYAEAAEREAEECRGEEEGKGESRWKERLGLAGGVASLVSLLLQATQKLLKEGELEQARPMVHELTELARDDPRSWDTAARLFEAQGRSDLAAQCRREEWKLRRAQQGEERSRRGNLGRDFRGADLSGTDLSIADLSGADLRGADLSGADLSRANLSEADLREADLRGANLSEADLRGADLSEADLSRADLREADLRGASLHGAHLCGANLWVADLSRADVRGADLSGANLSVATLNWADLRGANLTEADLCAAGIIATDFRGADFGAAFRGANSLVLEHLTLRGAITH